MVRKRTAWILTSLMVLGALVPSVGAALGTLEAPTLPVPFAMAGDAPSGNGYYSPFGVTPEQLAGLDAPSSTGSSSGSRPAPSQPLLNLGSYSELVERLAYDRDLQPNEFAAIVAEYLMGLGFGVPGASIDYAENASISYTHRLGDIDADGLDDVLLDQYCVDADDCRPRPTFNVLNPRGFLSSQLCYWPHRILALSGASGEERWNRTADHNVEQQGLVRTGCSIQFIVGVVPDGTNFHPVLYDWEVTPDPVFGAVLLFTHRISVLDAKTGQPLWTKTYEGSWIPDLATGSFLLVRNLFVQPILQVHPDAGVDLLPAPQKPSLILQGVGFNITFAGTPPPPWAVSGFLLYFGYYPDEWAAAVDPLTGKTLWQRDTFDPNNRVTSTPNTPGVDLPSQAPPVVGNRSVFPLSLQDPPLPHTTCIYDRSIRCPPLERQFNTLVAPQRQQMSYWGRQGCCFDVNGDQVPDLVFTVYEWSSTPFTNYEGPYSLASRLVMFDGATGKSLYDYYRQASLDLPPRLPANGGFYRMRVDSLGDVNGDKATDFFLHETFIVWDFLHNVSVMNGMDGKEVWRHSDKREFQVLPIGDANKDGSIDFALLNYTMDISFYATQFSLSNVTVTPLRVFNGADGAIVWAFEDFNAPTDVLFYFLNYRLNGLPDFDEDGVGDLLADDPLYLPDLTKVHRLSYVAGSDGHDLFRFVTAGEFAFPNLVGDVNADGVEDLFLLNGDINDLWGTTFDGANGTALWSRRVATARNANYFAAQPFIRTHPLHRNGTDEVDYMINLHLRMVNVVQFGARLRVDVTTKPQIMVFGGLNGTIPWAIPVVFDQNLTIVIEGPSPASRQYINALRYDAALDAVPPAAVVTPVEVVAGVATFGAALGSSFLISTRRLKP